MPCQRSPTPDLEDPLGPLDRAHPHTTRFLVALAEATTVSAVTALYAAADHTPVTAAVWESGLDRRAQQALVARHARAIGVRLVDAVCRSDVAIICALLENPAMTADHRARVAAWVAKTLGEVLGAWRAVAVARWWLANQPESAQHLVAPFAHACVLAAARGMSGHEVWEYLNGTADLPPNLVPAIIADALRAGARYGDAVDEEECALVTCRTLLQHPTAGRASWRLAAGVPSHQWAALAIVLASHAPAREDPVVWARLRAEPVNHAVLQHLLWAAPRTDVAPLLRAFVADFPNHVAAAVTAPAFTARTDLRPEDLVPLLDAAAYPIRELGMRLVGAMALATPTQTT